MSINFLEVCFISDKKDPQFSDQYDMLSAFVTNMNYCNAICDEFKIYNKFLWPKCIIIIIISISKEDNVFSIIASLPYGPPMNTDIDYYRT